MKITFLGTGTSTGVPQVGCSCEVCTSSDPRDKRLRTSALVETDTARVLIDCGPDFRQQILSCDFRSIDAVFVTHEHYDHVGGMDDLRPFSVFGDVPVYALERVAQQLRQTLPYCFVEHKYPGVPRLDLHVIRPHEAVQVGDLTVVPFCVMHGRLPILGFRIGPMVYITDMTEVPESEADYLQDAELLVVNGLRRKPHDTHQSIGQACDFARSIGAGRTFLVHMSHQAGRHADTDARLPEGIRLAYDGLTVEC